MSSSASPESEMNKDDKDRINAFSRLLAERSDLSETLKTRKKLLELHEDAADELMLADDDEPVQYNVGDAFFFETKDFVEEEVDKAKGKLAKDVKDIESRLEAVNSEMKSIKALLYTKFGDSINLEAED